MPHHEIRPGLLAGIGANLLAVAFSLTILGHRRGEPVPYMPLTAAFTLLTAPVVAVSLVLSLVDIVRRRRGKETWVGLLLCLTALPLYFVVSALLMRLLGLNDD